MFLYTALPLTIAGVAVYMDFRTAKVDNAWILFSLIIGLAFRLFCQGLIGILSFAAGVTFPLLILGVLFYFRMLGPGDIKVFCVLGGIMGLRGIGNCMLYAFFIGGIFSLVLLLLYGDFRQRFQYFFQYVQDYLTTGVVKPYYKAGMPEENFHFTVPIFLSVVLYAGGFY